MEEGVNGRGVGWRQDECIEMDGEKLWMEKEMDGEAFDTDEMKGG